MLLTQKYPAHCEYTDNVSVKEMYQVQWKRVRSVRCVLEKMEQRILV